MAKFNYIKSVNVAQLGEELKAAGITNFNITYEKVNNSLIVECNLNPDAVVNNHTPQIKDAKAEYSALLLDNEKINYIAKRLGLK